MKVILLNREQYLNDVTRCIKIFIKPTNIDELIYGLVELN